MNHITQAHITEQTPIGTNLVKDSTEGYLGVTVRVLGPNASAVYLNGDFNGVNAFTKGQDKNLLLQKRGEYWTGFLAGAKPGDTYKFSDIGKWEHQKATLQSAIEQRRQKIETLTVRLHHLTARVHDEVIIRLCEELTATETVYPGTDLRLIFQLVGSS